MDGVNYGFSVSCEVLSWGRILLWKCVISVFLVYFGCWFSVYIVVCVLVFLFMYLNGLWFWYLSSVLKLLVCDLLFSRLWLKIVSSCGLGRNGVRVRNMKWYFGYCLY